MSSPFADNNIAVILGMFMAVYGAVLSTVNSFLQWRTSSRDRAYVRLHIFDFLERIHRESGRAFVATWKTNRQRHDGFRFEILQTVLNMLPIVTNPVFSRP